MLYLHSVAHLLVDALCAATLFGPVVNAGADYFSMCLLYNTLAFSTQCVVGLLADRIRRHRLSAGISMLVVILGFALPIPAVLRVILVGCGNSVFHVAAGADVLERSEGKAGPLGVFVAPGAIGLTLGILWPKLGLLFAFLMGIAAIVELLAASRRTVVADDHIGHPRTVVADDHIGQKPIMVEMLNGRCGQRPLRNEKPMILVVLLTAAVAVRAIGGTAVVFPWKSGVWATLGITFCVFLGKTGGGFLCDRLGAKKTALLSLPLSAVLIAFCASWAAPSLLGQLLLNLTMPVTLWLLYKLMPESPGFAFGLAASALWPGTILGTLLLGSLREVWILLCFLFGLFAILYACKKKETERME